MERIYLDYAASAPLAPEAIKVIEKFLLTEPVGNPSSLHTEGRKMQAYLDRAHTTVGAVFGVHPTEVIFTSGATESNVQAIKGVLQTWRLHHEGTPHIVLSAIEHASWRQVAKSEDVEITLIPVSRKGVVDSAHVLGAIKSNTALVGCMFVNNEIGTLQPVEAIGKGIEQLRHKTGSRWPVFHVDAVQAFPYVNTHSGHMHADLVTFSGHKYGALGGIGVLIAKKQTPISAVIKGGSQEWGHRAGTENVLGAISLAAVVEHADAERVKLSHHVTVLQEYLEALVVKHVPKAEILGQKSARVPHVTYLWLSNVLDEHIVHKLDLAGVAVSSGSACSSGAMLPSSTLMAMGYDEKEAFGGIRVSYGRFTTKKELEKFVLLLKDFLK